MAGRRRAHARLRRARPLRARPLVHHPARRRSRRSVRSEARCARRENVPVCRFSRGRCDRHRGREPAPGRGQSRSGRCREPAGYELTLSSLRPEDALAYEEESDEAKKRSSSSARRARAACAWSRAGREIASSGTTWSSRSSSRAGVASPGLASSAVTVRSAGRIARVVKASDLAVTAKLGSEGSLVWVTRLSSGAPVGERGRGAPAQGAADPALPHRRARARRDSGCRVCAARATATRSRRTRWSSRGAAATGRTKPHRASSAAVAAAGAERPVQAGSALRHDVHRARSLPSGRRGARQGDRAARDALRQCRRRGPNHRGGACVAERRGRRAAQGHDERHSARLRSRRAFRRARASERFSSRVSRRTCPPASARPSRSPSIGPPSSACASLQRRAYLSARRIRALRSARRLPVRCTHERRGGALHAQPKSRSGSRFRGTKATSVNAASYQADLEQAPARFRHHRKRRRQARRVGAARRHSGASPCRDSAVPNAS